MTKTEFLALLNTIDFPRKYWEMCDRYPYDPEGGLSTGRKEVILEAFAEMGLKPHYCREGLFTLEKERIGEADWAGVFMKQRYGLELVITGDCRGEHLGGQFCSLAYDAKRLEDPSYERPRFGEPAPYPRPCFNGDPVLLRAIVREFVHLIREIKDALRALSVPGPRTSAHTEESTRP